MSRGGGREIQGCTGTERGGRGTEGNRDKKEQREGCEIEEERE